MALMCLDDAHGKEWSAYNGDCYDVCRQLPDHSVGFHLYSIPFFQLFVYSDSIADLGNSANEAEFTEQYAYLVREQMRITKPGRHVAVHCSDIPLQKWKDGVIGINPLSDKVSQIHRDAGMILHSKVTIWKDPVVEMQRTKAIGLLHKQVIKDSVRSRMGMPDYMLVFRVPGENAEPVGHKPQDFPVEQWQRWASPVWMDIRQTNTLNVKQARENSDEKHLVPLQLDLIERCLVLWSNPGDVVLSPFMGIGSEGYVSLKQKRKFIGVELKGSYFKTAVKNLTVAEAHAPSLFDAVQPYEPRPRKRA